MKLGILTMPQRSNYGGVLQAYALQTVLERMGHDVIILQRDYPDKRESLKYKILQFLLFVKYKIKNKKCPVISKKEEKVINSKIDDFVQLYLLRSPLFTTSKSLSQYCSINKIQGIVVGSDQVWRPRFCPCLQDYFLEFTKEHNVKRIAYGTSFGVDNWEYNDEETRMCKRLIKNFDAVSVREDSAIDLCKNFLEIEAKHVLDPTLLLSKEEYIDIAKKGNSSKSCGQLFYYVLDQCEEKLNVLKGISESVGYHSYGCMPEKSYHGSIQENVNKYIFPSPVQWIKSFMDAEMVVTDSFHGTVFSILFNKPFWVLENENRGNTRMESLLRMFKLEDRMISVKNIENFNWIKCIDWNSVNDLLAKKRFESISFIRDSLN